MNLLKASIALFFCSCAKENYVLTTPARPVSKIEGREARESAIRGDMAAIDTMVGWAFEHTPLDEEGNSETLQYWQGMMVRAANKKGLRTYYPPDCGIYKGRIAKERMKP